MTEDDFIAQAQEKLPPTKSKGRAQCERIVVTAADGRTWDLGSPDSRLFRLRIWVYRLRRRSELRHG